VFVVINVFSLCITARLCLCLLMCFLFSLKTTILLRSFDWYVNDDWHLFLSLHDGTFSFLEVLNLLGLNSLQANFFLTNWFCSLHGLLFAANKLNGDHGRIWLLHYFRYNPITMKLRSNSNTVQLLTLTVNERHLSFFFFWQKFHCIRCKLTSNWNCY
jgi:hypothetical protein